MAEVTASYKTALPPHIRSSDSLAKRYWGQLIALLPLFVTACFTGHAEILRVLAICLVSAIAFEFQSTGTPRTLPPKVENDLLRIGQEALTNAVRHAKGQHIALALDFQESTVCLAVTVDGRGLAAESTGSPDGGFGLPGMRERARAINADLNLRSVPGTGTTIELIVHHV